MSYSHSEIDRAVRNAKRIVLVARLRLALVLVVVCILAVIALGNAIRLHKNLGGTLEAAYLILTGLAVITAGVWLRHRHGPKVFWIALLSVSLTLWLWLRYQL